MSVILTLFGCLTAAVIWPLSAGVLLSGVWRIPYNERRAGVSHPDAVPFPLMPLNYVLTQQLIGWHGQKTYAVVCALALVLNVSAKPLADSCHGHRRRSLGDRVATEVVVTVGALGPARSL